MDFPLILTNADAACITEAFEAIAGSVTGDLVEDAPRITVADPKWNAQALSLLERMDASRSDGDGPTWSTQSLRNLITRAAEVANAPKTS